MSRSASFRRVHFILALPLALAALALTVAPALARSTHEYTGISFGPGGTSATHFERPAAIAIDQTTHDVYVADPGTDSIYRFNENGEPADFTGTAPYLSANAITGINFYPRSGWNQIAVNSTNGDIYTNDGFYTLAVFQENGEPADFSAGPGAGTNEIGGFYFLFGLAVDSHGDIYAGS
jgi:hypothetical protein